MSTTRGNFSSVPSVDKYEGYLLQDAYDAITAAEAWDYFRTFSEESFMFSRSAVLTQVQARMKTMEEHSGSSYGFVMRTMEAIAKEGWEKWAAARAAHAASRSSAGAGGSA
jgi:hypothetical protein